MQNPPEKTYTKTLQGNTIFIIQQTHMAHTFTTQNGIQPQIGLKGMAGASGMVSILMRTKSGFVVQQKGNKNSSEKYPQICSGTDASPSQRNLHIYISTSLPPSEWQGGDKILIKNAYLWSGMS